MEIEKSDGPSNWIPPPLKRALWGTFFYHFEGLSNPSLKKVLQTILASILTRYRCHYFSKSPYLTILTISVQLKAFEQFKN